MKNSIIALAVISIAITSCNNSNQDTAPKNKDTAQVINKPAEETSAPVDANATVDRSMREMVSQYLDLKNALANDNGKEAAIAGNVFVESMSNMDKNSLSPEKRKTWEDLSDDAKEMAGHIARNAGKIEHQREHFDMLSKDMYDMVKTFGAGQTLYKTFCPMYNDSKGASWLSETREIKNPYFGKKMLKCGSVKEEIR